MNIGNHVSITLSQQVQLICQPFFDAIGINYFHYTKLYHTQEVTMLNTDPEWMKFFFEHEFVLTTSYIQAGPMYFDRGSTIVAEPWVDIMAEEFNHCQHFAFTIDHITGYREACYFAAPTTAHNMAELYFKNLDKIQNFIFYFKEKAAQLLKLADHHRILLPNSMIREQAKNPVIEQNKPMPTRYIIDVPDHEVCKTYLTPKEMQCALYFIQGKTSKAIGQQLNISARTVETHLANIRDKLGTQSRQELRKILHPYQRLVNF